MGLKLCTSAFCSGNGATDLGHGYIEDREAERTRANTIAATSATAKAGSAVRTGHMTSERTSRRECPGGESVHA